MQVRFVSCVHCCSAERSILNSGGVGLAGWRDGARCARSFLTWHDAIGNRFRLQALLDFAAGESLAEPSECALATS